MPFAPEITSPLEDMLKKKQQRMDMGGVLRLEDEESEYYVQHKTSLEELQSDKRSEHQIESKLSSVRQAVQAVMPEAYTAIDNVRTSPVEDMRKTKLHHSRGKQLSEGPEGESVLEFDMAGSGFKQFRTEHHGFHGKGTLKIGDEDVKLVKEKDLKKESEVSWYNKSRWVNWLPFVRTEEQIIEDNKKIRAKNLATLARNAVIERAIEKQYGESQEIEGKKLEHVRKKESDNKTRISMAGPLGMGGMKNSGDYSIENLRHYMQVMAQDYLTNIFDTWKNADDAHDIHIIIKGHSRGAVASAEGAMMIKQWVFENYPKYEQFVKFELTQYDPVPGTGSKDGVNEEVDLRGKETITQDKARMRPLGDSAETTVMYSLHADNDFAHRNFFDPQAVKGAKRVILTPFKHGVGLGDIDDAKVKLQNSGRESQQHRPGYTDAATGEVYRSSGLNELPAGVYIVDEQNTLIRFNTYAEAERVVKTVLKDASGQSERHKTVLAMAKSWFNKQESDERIKNYTQDFEQMHNKRETQRKQVEEREKNEDIEALFSQFTELQKQSDEVQRAKQAKDKAALLKLLNPATDTPQELSSVFDVSKNGFTDPRDKESINERLKLTDPMSRLLLQRSQGYLSVFREEGDAGYYSVRDRSIAVNKQDDRAEIRGTGQVLFHEMGHMTDNICKNLITIEAKIEQNDVKLESIVNVFTEYKTFLDELRKLRGAMKPEDYLESQKAIVKDIISENPGLDSNIVSSFSYPRNEALSTAKVSGGKFHEAMQTDYQNYVDKFIKVAYGENEDEEAEEKVKEAIKNRIYWDIVARAQYASENQISMKMFGGSVEAAEKMAAEEFESVTAGKSINEQRKWLQNHDPLKMVKGQTHQYMMCSGISDIFGSFARTADESDEEANIVNDIMCYGHSEEYWRNQGSMVEVQRKNGTTVEVQGLRMKECWAEMTAVQCGGSNQAEMFYREFMPNSYAVYKEIRRDAVKGKSE